MASLAEFEQSAPSIMGSVEWRDWYQRFVPLCESGCREVCNMVE